MTGHDDRTLGIALARGPGTADARAAVEMAIAARHLGVRTDLFLTHLATELLARPDLDRLLAAGVRVAVCSRAALAMGLAGHREGVDYASQFQLGRLVEHCDRFVSFL